jgi:hypothetical protein
MPSKQHHFDEIPGLEIPHTPFTNFKNSSKGQEQNPPKIVGQNICQAGRTYNIHTYDVVCRLHVQLKRRDYSNANVLHIM